MQLTSKHGEYVVKPKIGFSIFLNSFFDNHIKLTAMRTLPQGSICFLVLRHYFKMIYCMILIVHFIIFCRYYYRYDVKVDAIFPSLHFRGMNRTYV